MKLKMGDGIKWPYHAPIAVMVTFDFDAELLRYATSGKEHIEFPDESRGHYGPREGLSRCLDVLKKNEIKSTFFVPGYNVWKYPDEVKSIVNDGHELAYHGYLHENSMDTPAQEEAACMEKSEALLCEASGRKVIGHRAPTGMLHPYSIELMQKRGYRYSSVMKDRDWPYLHTGNPDYEPIVELPTEHTLDDYTYFYFSFAPPTNRSNYPVSYVESIWRDYFDELADETDKVFVLKLHPQLIGRSSRAAMLDHFIKYMKQRGAWITTCAEAADYIREFYRTKKED